MNLPELIEAITKFVSAAAWPVLIGLIVCYFRKEIRKLLSELRVIGGSDLWAYLGSSPAEPQRPLEQAMLGKSQASPSPIPFDKAKYGNAFWVGHDLLWTVAQLLSKGPQSKILEGLSQSKHHLNELRFVEPSFSSRLERIYQEALHSSESDWTTELRVRVATEIQILARELGGIIAANQPAFKSHPSS